MARIDTLCSRAILVLDEDIVMAQRSTVLGNLKIYSGDTAPQQLGRRSKAQKGAKRLR